MRIHDKDWATYDLLGDIEFKNRSKLASLRFYLKAAELTDNPQMKKKFLEIRNKIKKDTKIAFLCLPGLDNFLKDIVETSSLGYDVKLVVSTDANEITQAIKWADIVWLEWANELAVFATNKIPEIANKKVICRLHREDNYSLEQQIYEIEEIVEDFYKSKSFEKKLEDMENCLVTIGVTNYNSEKYVKEFLDSVINQTFKNIELIIVDDHSTDKSVEIIKEYERKYDFIKLIEHEVNKGCPDYGRNEILNAANGEYVLFLDSDDKFTYNYSLEKLVDFIQRNKELDYVYTDYAIIDDNSQIINKGESKIFTKEEIIRTVFNRIGSGILPGKGLFKVDFFRRFNISYPINGMAADTLLSLICLKADLYSTLALLKQTLGSISLVRNAIPRINRGIRK